MWQRALRVSDLPEGSARSLELEGKRVGLFHVGKKFYAMNDTCPHRGGPLGDGHLEGTVVTCPWHAWDFDVTSGWCLTMEGGQQKCYATKVENEEVWIEL